MSGDNHSRRGSTQLQAQRELEQAVHNETAGTLDCAYNCKTVPCAFQIGFDNSHEAAGPVVEADGNKNLEEAGEQVQVAVVRHIGSGTGPGLDYMAESASSLCSVGAPWAGNHCWIDSSGPCLPCWDVEGRRKSCCLHWKRTWGDRFHP